MIEGVLTCDDCDEAVLDADEFVTTTGIDGAVIAATVVKLCVPCYEERCNKSERIYDGNND